MTHPPPAHPPDPQPGQCKASLRATGITAGTGQSPELNTATVCPLCCFQDYQEPAEHPVQSQSRAIGSQVAAGTGQSPVPSAAMICIVLPSRRCRASRGSQEEEVAAGVRQPSAPDAEVCSTVFACQTLHYKKMPGLSPPDAGHADASSSSMHTPACSKYPSGGHTRGPGL